MAGVRPGPSTVEGLRWSARWFRISSDTFGALNLGEAVIYTPIAEQPTRANISPVWLRTPTRIDPTGPRTDCEIAVHAEQMLPGGGPSDGPPLAQRTGPAPAI